MQTRTTAVERRSSPLSWLNVVAGAALFVAPWVLGYTAEVAAFANHLIVGAVAALAGLLAATLDRGWEWVNVVGGAYTIVAILLFAYGSGVAIGVSIILGAIIGLLALGGALSRQEA